MLGDEEEAEDPHHDGLTMGDLTQGLRNSPRSANVLLPELFLN